MKITNTENSKAITHYDKVKEKLLDFFKIAIREDEDYATGIMALSAALGMFSSASIDMFSGENKIFRNLLDILVLPESEEVLQDFLLSEFAEYKIIMLQEKLASK